MWTREAFPRSPESSRHLALPLGGGGTSQASWSTWGVVHLDENLHAVCCKELAGLGGDCQWTWRWAEDDRLHPTSSHREIPQIAVCSKGESQNNSDL